jgi:hypothetical protein
LPNPHDVERVGTRAGGLHDGGVGSHSKDIPNVTTDAFGGLHVVELDLNGEIAPDDVQTTGEPKNCRQLRDTVGGLCGGGRDELVFHRNRQ